MILQRTIFPFSVSGPYAPNNAKKDTPTNVESYRLACLEQPSITTPKTRKPNPDAPNNSKNLRHIIYKITNFLHYLAHRGQKQKTEKLISNTMGPRESHSHSRELLLAVRAKPATMPKREQIENWIFCR
ncbi:hypothetical protein [Methylomicrobium sp. Wu6]|uniref:hypothetical protein n=1 Tax=Methylomicrobium sp. Wu6 TaxID=3107928 RepID=UPI002DD61AFA|nr:hypothetical protein [Methylomicrobium sp. Wu6]MEC4748584.1 hypothetical protein [Methylomicrobium sp. Wu6]